MDKTHTMAHGSGTVTHKIGTALSGVFFLTLWLISAAFSLLGVALRIGLLALAFALVLKAFGLI